MQKVFIKNRKNQNICVVVEEVANSKGLAFVMHGLKGFKEQPQVETIAKAFKDNGYSVIRFDTTNTIGESDGDVSKATTTNYLEDLEDVIKWASHEKWYQKPFVLSGISLGGLCVAHYAEKFPENVKALLPTSIVVSGKLSADSRPDETNEWKEKGFRTMVSKSKPGVTAILPWSHMVDRLTYDLLPEAKKLTMPVLLVAGDEDKVTPIKHQKILYKELSGKKDLKIIKGSGHVFRGAALPELYNICSKWVAKL